MLELLFKGLFQWVYDLFLELVDFLSNALLAVFSMDLSFFMTTVPVASDILIILRAVGWALLLGNLVFQAAKSMLSGAGFEGEDPKLLFTRTSFFAFFLVASDQICSVGLDLTQQVIALLQVPESVTVKVPDEAIFNTGAAWLLVGIIGVVVGWQYIKLCIEVGERYVVLASLTILAPLAFGVGGSQSTADIFKGWLRMYGSMCFMMISNVVFLKMLISALGYVPVGLDSIPWAILIVGIARVARKVDEIITRIGLNPAITGSGLGQSLPGMLAFTVIRSMAGTIGRTVGHSMGGSRTPPPGGGNSTSSGGGGKRTVHWFQGGTGHAGKTAQGSHAPGASGQTFGSTSSYYAQAGKEAPGSPGTPGAAGSSHPGFSTPSHERGSTPAGSVHGQDMTGDVTHRSTDGAPHIPGTNQGASAKPKAPYTGSPGSTTPFGSQSTYQPGDVHGPTPQSPGTPGHRAGQDREAAAVFSGAPMGGQSGRPETSSTVPVGHSGSVPPERTQGGSTRRSSVRPGSAVRSYVGEATVNGKRPAKGAETDHGRTAGPRPMRPPISRGEARTESVPGTAGAPRSQPPGGIVKEGATRYTDAPHRDSVPKPGTAGTSDAGRIAPAPGIVHAEQSSTDTYRQSGVTTHSQTNSHRSEVTGTRPGIPRQESPASLTPQGLHDKSKTPVGAGRSESSHLHPPTPTVLAPPGGGQERPTSTHPPTPTAPTSPGGGQERPTSSHPPTPTAPTIPRGGQERPTSTHSPTPTAPTIPRGGQERSTSSHPPTPTAPTIPRGGQERPTSMHPPTPTAPAPPRGGQERPTSSHPPTPTAPVPPRGGQERPTSTHLPTPTAPPIPRGGQGQLHSGVNPGKKQKKKGNRRGRNQK